MSSTERTTAKPSRRGGTSPGAGRWIGRGPTTPASSQLTTSRRACPGSTSGPPPPARLRAGYRYGAGSPGQRRRAVVLGQRPEAPRARRDVAGRQVGLRRVRQTEARPPGQVAALPLDRPPVRVVGVGDGVLQPADPLELHRQAVDAGLPEGAVHRVPVVPARPPWPGSSRPGGSSGGRSGPPRRGRCRRTPRWRPRPQAPVEPGRRDQIVRAPHLVRGDDDRGPTGPAPVGRLAAGRDPAQAHPGDAGPSRRRVRLLLVAPVVRVVADGVAEDVVHRHAGVDPAGPAASGPITTPSSMSEPAVPAASASSGSPWPSSAVMGRNRGAGTGQGGLGGRWWAITCVFRTGRGTGAARGGGCQVIRSSSRHTVSAQAPSTVRATCHRVRSRSSRATTAWRPWRTTSSMSRGAVSVPQGPRQGVRQVMRRACRSSSSTAPPTSTTTASGVPGRAVRMPVRYAPSSRNVSSFIRGRRPGAARPDSRPVAERPCPGPCARLRLLRASR